MTPISMNKITRVILAIAGLYSLTAALWFLSTYANDSHRALGPLIFSNLYLVAMPVLPYALFGVASWFARIRWKQVTLLIAVFVSAVASVILYADAFTKVEPEFGMAFTIVGGVQMFIAVVVVIIAL